MYKCNKCQKKFKYDSELIRHNNRKISCDAPKKEYKCIICNTNFICSAEQERHNKTKKHINNLKSNTKNSINNIEQSNNDLKKELEDKIINLENVITELKNINNEYENMIKELKNSDIIYKDTISKLKNSNNEYENTIKELKNNIIHLENENHNLKINNKLHVDNECIYIIHSAQHINTNIYKVGRTKNITNRLKQYPKGSELLYMFSCVNSKSVETKILQYLNANNDFKQIKTSGNEYFQCDVNLLKNTIFKFVN